MSTEQMRKEFEAWYMGEKAKDGCALHRLGAWDAWQAAINQSATVAALVQERDALQADSDSLMAMCELLRREKVKVAALESQLAAPPKTQMHENAADALFLDWYDEDAPGLALIRGVEAWHGINAAAQGAQEGGT